MKFIFWNGIFCKHGPEHKEGIRRNGLLYWEVETMYGDKYLARHDHLELAKFDNQPNKGNQ